MLNRCISLACRVFVGITSEQEHRGMTVQQGGVKVGWLETLYTLLLCDRSERSPMQLVCVTALITAEWETERTVVQSKIL